MPSEIKEKLLDTKMCVTNTIKSVSSEEYFETLVREKWYLYNTMSIFIQAELRAHGKKQWMHQACRWTQLYT